MHLIFKPKTLILFTSTILLAGLATIILEFYSGDLLKEIFGPAELPNRTQVSTAAIVTERGWVRVGVRQDISPFGFVNSTGDLVGFDIDLAREVAKRWLGDETAIEFVAVSSADRIPRLASGDVDLLFAAMPYKRERDAFIDFSQPYFIDGQTLLVRQDSEINTIADLDNKIVALLQDAFTQEPLKQAAAVANIALETTSFDSYSQALAALTAGEIDAITGDMVTLNQFTGTTPGLRMLSNRLTPEYYAAGLPQADSTLRAMLNFTLQDMKADGTYDALYHHWFPADEPMAMEISPGAWSYTTLSQLPNEPVPVTQSHVEVMLNRRRLIAAVHNDFWPFSSINEQGQRVGFDIDIVREFAKRWLGDPNAVELLEGDPATQVNRLVAGEVDLIAAALVEQREWAQQIDFSQSYLGPPVMSLPLTIGLPQYDAIYRELVNVTLQEMKVDGTYDSIHQKWFGPEAQQYALTVIPGDAGYLLSSLNNLATLPRVRAVSDSTIARIRARSNTLRIGVAIDHAPFSIQTETGQFDGFDIELVRALAKTWNIAVELVPVTPADQIQKLRRGEVDLLAAGLERTKNQEAELDFSQTYFVGGASLLVNAGSNIKVVADLHNQIIVTLELSSLGEQLQALAEASEITVNVITYPNYQAAITELRQGTVAGLLIDSTALAQFTNNSTEWAVISNILGETPYSFGLPADDSYFNNLVNITLQQLKANGTYDALYQKWFGSEATPYPLEVLPGSWPYTFAESPTTLDVPIRSKVEEIQQKGELVAGIPFDLAPFGSGDETNLVGFDIDIVREFAKRWLGDANAINFVSVTAADAAQILAEGGVDLVAAALPHLADAEESIDFSQTYYHGQQALLIRTDEQLTNLAALNNKTLAAIQGAPSIAQLQDIANREGISVNILPYPTYRAAYEALAVGQVNGLIGLQPVLEQFTLNESGFVVLSGLFPTAAYGIGIPNYDGRFQDLINFTLQEMKVDGTYDRLYRRWLGQSEPSSIEIWPGRSYLELDMIPMVRIPAGEFVQGNLYGFPDERAEQTIFLDEFYVDQYEVTNRQYADCVRVGRCNLPQLPRSVNFTNYYAATEFGNYPVIWITWHDAVNYCAFRGKRLPTEAEWEKAARGVDNTLYPWGKEEPTLEANFNYIAGDVTAVGSFPQDINGYGVYDMGGNVREWVSDWYQWDYYLDAPQKNPLGPAGRCDESSARWQLERCCNLHTSNFTQKFSTGEL